MINGIILFSAIIITIAIHWISKHPKSAPHLTKAVPIIPIICLTIWIAYTCLWYKLPMNIIFNILCIGMVIIGYKLLHEKKKLGLYVIISSALLHISNSFLFLNGKFEPTDNIAACWLPSINERDFYVSIQESLIGCIILDAIFLLMLLIPLLIKEESGARPYSYLKPFDHPSKKIRALRGFCIFSIIAFFLIMFIYPAWRFYHDGIKEYETTYYIPAPYYDSEGDLGYYSIRWVFSSYHTVFVAFPKEIRDAIERIKSEKKEQEKTQIADKKKQQPTSNPSIKSNSETEGVETAELVTIQEGSSTRIYVKLSDGQLIDLNTYLSQFKDVNIPINNSNNMQINNGHMPPVNNGYMPPVNNGYMPPDIYNSRPSLFERFTSSSEHECWECHGLKVCPRCGGTTQRPVDSWDGTSYIPCQYCDATGRCPVCKGSGKLFY